MSARFKRGEGVLMINHQPGAGVQAGDVLQLGAGEQGRAFIAHRDIAANELGAVAAPGGNGTYELDKGAEVIAIGAEVFVTLATGMFSTGPSADGTVVSAGYATAGASAADTVVEFVHDIVEDLSV